MKVAIVFQSPYGQTKKIAQQIKQNLVFESQFKDNVHLIEVDNIKSPFEVYGPIDIFIIGFPVYVGNFPKSLMKWVREHRDDLMKRRIGFFTVSLNAADARSGARLDDDRLLQKLIKETGLVPDFIAPFAGTLHYTKYGFIKKFILKQISKSAGGPTDTSKDHELTLWSDVKDFSDAIRENDTRSPFYFMHQLSPSKINQPQLPILSDKLITNYQE